MLCVTLITGGRAKKIVKVIIVDVDTIFRVDVVAGVAPTVDKMCLCYVAEWVGRQI